jgi:hypothetical protein
MRTALIVLATAVLAAPAGATIININSQISGATSVDLSPLTVSGVVSPVQLTLGPGVYTLTLVQPPTAGALYTAWARATSGYYSTSYVVYDANNTSTPLLYGGEYLSASTAAGAWNQTLADQLNVSHLTLSSVTTLDFVVPDIFLGDNSGGVSIDVEIPTNAVPALYYPALAVLAMLLMAGGAFFLYKRHGMVPDSH